MLFLGLLSLNALHVNHHPGGMVLGEVIGHFGAGTALTLAGLGILIVSARKKEKVNQ